MSKNVVLIILSLLAFLFVVYLLKSHRGVDLFESLSLSEKLPFTSFHEPEKPESILSYAPNQSIVIKENFEDGLKSGGWDNLWARDRGTVIRRLDRDQEKGTNHIFIRNLGHEDWTIEHDRLILISPGEEFHYQGRLKTTREATAGLGVALLDKDRQIMDWMHAARMVQYQSEWTEVSNTFTIPEGAAYMRFRLTGSGKGEVFADDFFLKRTEPADDKSRQYRDFDFSPWQPKPRSER
jgi:hypothetical protein